MSTLIGDFGYVVVNWGHADTLKKALKTLAPGRELEIENFLAQYKVYGNGRPTNRAGQCDNRNKRLEVHTDLLLPARVKHRDSTFLHEAAHAIAFAIFRSRGHDRAWYATMRAFGQPERRTHSYAFGKFKERFPKGYKIIAKCPVCDEYVRGWKLIGDAIANGMVSRHDCGAKLVPATDPIESAEDKWADLV